MLYYEVSLIILLILLISSILYIFLKNKEESEDYREMYGEEFEECPYNRKDKSIKSRIKVIKNLDKCYQDILNGYDYINSEANRKKDIPPAGEWLLDNLYLIQKEYKSIKSSMPNDYYENLPLINKGAIKGYPRIYHIARKIVYKTEGKVNGEYIEKFIDEYQKHTILTSGELWALPVMIRVALIQNICEVTKDIVYAQSEKNKGETVAERLIENSNNEEALENLFKENINFTPYFTEKLLKVLRDSGFENEDVYSWIDEKLVMQDINGEKIVLLEHKRQALFRMIIGNSITGIREISSLNWREYFEKLSYLEKTLKEDPADIYENMDFATRDFYRHKIEKLARHMKLGESFVAKKAIECAKEATEHEGNPYLKHVGYYIIDEGIQCLKDKIGFKDHGFRKLKYINKSKRANYYISFITFLTLTLAFILMYFNFNPYSTPLWQYILTFIVILIPCSEIIISVTNWSITHLSRPEIIPKLEFKEEIPEEYSSIVVISTLINSEKRAKELAKDLEVYYLGNRCKNIYYAILGDFKDNKEKDHIDDEKIINSALKEIKRLNDKYAKEGEEIFYFFNRYRQYNEKENVWLGWERKRGKLVEFNRLIRGDENTSYNVISGDIEKLYKVKYVITLDADTKLPRDSSKKLIASMAHPLNHPYVDKDNKRVLRGYGLMQPRINISNISANKTLFSKIFSGETGIDHYTTAISDVYQDMFGEGIFTGKGIYDVDIFNFMLGDEIPENSVLSHDLLEGSYVRTALLTDIELIDGYPAYYNSSCKRLHRWVRGDWQLLPWIYKRSSLNKLSKWKMLDNLRRSLLSPSIILLIILSLSVLEASEGWIILSFIALISPLLFDISEAVIAPIKGISLSGKIKNWKVGIEQFFLIFSFVPHQAYLMTDAIIRTLYRLKITKKNLLEWQTAADAEVSSGKRLIDYIRYMWVGSFISLIIAFLALYKSASLGFILLPSCIIWFFSPYTAYYISKDIKRETYKIGIEEKIILRGIGRRIWAYFEDFNNEENNWLAPDNFQEYPENGVAPRTSPTNMAMGLISNIIAYDLGYIGLTQCIHKIEKTVESMKTLEMYEGHFYNWYNTKTKEPLYPKYISTVDSGNLLGYIWLTNRTLEEYIENPIFNIDMAKGLGDLLILSNEELKDMHSDFYKDSLEWVSKWDGDLVEYIKGLNKISDSINVIEKGDKWKELYWNKKLKDTVRDNVINIFNLFPWLEIEYFTNEEEMYLEELKSIANKSGINDILIALQELKDRLHDKSEVLYKAVLKGESNLKDLLSLIIKIKEYLEEIEEEMDFKMLFEESRQLFSIGYNVERGKIDNCYYDLLASEARQASFLAISKGDVEQDHWFKLGRTLTSVKNNKGLVSWSGTMFEYLMPLLIMKSYPDTLLNSTYNFVVESQRAYGNKNNVPWGISESGFYAFDINLNYQYKAFGVPGVGLKRGLSKDLVISPYSTIMALQVNIKDSILNIKRFIKEGFLGRYGLYEAIDFTKERLPKDEKYKIVKSYMVHHQGMSLMALDNLINNNVLQERFHRDPRVKASELLLQEKVPNMVVYDREEKYEENLFIKDKNVGMIRRYTTAKTSYPEANILSNGNYSVMVTNRGSGYSKKEDMNVYRWREDITNDNTGMLFYIKNLNSNEYWSNYYQPCKHEGEEYEVIFAQDKAEFRRKDGNLYTVTEIGVCSEDNGEVRKISITNNSNSNRTIEVTSYFEVILTNYNSDLVHPTFSNLFVRTDFQEDPMCLLANRRKREKEGKEPWVMHTVIGDEKISGKIQYETSRASFIGRNRDLHKPEVMENDAPLTNTKGAVLDPILSLRVRVEIPSGETCKLAFITALGDSREEVIKLAEKYRDWNNVNRVFELTWTQAQVENRYLGINSSMANLYQSIASKIIFMNNSFKEREKYIKAINRGQSELWKYGISGDLPIVLLIIRKEEDLELLRQLLKAHEYWNIKGLKTDLIILNLEDTAYIQPLEDGIKELVFSSYARDKINKSGGAFLYNKATMSYEDINLIMSIARLVIDGDKGSLSSQVKVNLGLQYNYELLERKEINYKEGNFTFAVPELQYFNSLGGFSTEGDKYFIILDNYNNTPAPWINVISNRDFGFHISESGISYTWNKNSRENKITTWSNDPVKDSEAEGLYIRDEYTGDVWSISPKPVRNNGKYIVEHGFGYSSFRHKAYGIAGEFTTFASLNKSVKLCIVKLKNDTDIERQLSLTYYAQLALGVVPQGTAQYISTYINEEGEYIHAKNPYSSNFGNLIAFLKVVGGEETTFTGDRREFIGKEGSFESPEILNKKSFSNVVGAGLDPCMAVNTKISVNPGEEKTLLVILGQEENINNVDEIIKEYSSTEIALRELDKVRDYWKEILGVIQIETPDKTMDIMINGWLMYQVIVCRYWARTAFYQSGGAYGFRDQLQDTLAISYLKPEITKEQILYSSSRQFIEGDVQHWWHPVVDSGIRTRFSDDLLWLPYVTLQYIKNTGDYSILDHEVPYLEDEPLREGEDERYNIARKSEIKESVYKHCVKTIDRALKFGEHNIPLMGSGDWNDGMSTVGNKGKGESVWLGWFLYTILKDFIRICDIKGDSEREKRYKEMLQFIIDNIEKNAWDGNWYRRAYFDDGTPLGSSENDECQIDSLSQSWAVISGGAKESRKKEAILSVERYLVKYDKGLVMLLTPPFHNSSLEPGYIKGYVPGVRENGGQYTHAAIWYILALTMVGFNDKACNIFNMINPINHARSYLDCQRYKVEPYVVTADVYAVEPHVGRGGWSWYTGAAGWMYTTAINGILGFKLKENEGFTIEPRIPENWNGYKMTYKRGECIYHIYVERGKEFSILLNDKPLEKNIIPFMENGEHRVKVIIKD